MQSISDMVVNDISIAAQDATRVTGLTHTFYKYPARLSPIFVRAVIEAFSQPGDWVLDPFVGSGTTPAVAKKLRRRYLGIELSKQYVTETRTRLAKIKPGDPLDGTDDPLTSVANTANGTIRTADGKRVKRDGAPRRNRSPRQSARAKDAPS